MKQPSPNNNFVSQPSFNTNYMQQPMPNLNEINDPTTAMNMALNVGNQNVFIVVPGIANQNGNDNVVAARAEGDGNRNNGNQIRYYKCRGEGHYARNCTARPRRRDVIFLQTQLLIAQKEEAGIQLQAKEFDLMASAEEIEKIKEVNANCILMANLQQASSSGTQADKTLDYNSDGSAEAHQSKNYYNNDIFNMDLNMEHSGGTVDQNLVTVEETRAYFESLYNNLVIEVEEVNTVNRKMRETNANLTAKLARYKGQEKYDKLKRCYQKSVIKSNVLLKR
ncbi:retrovirus-related pol polyprotein from transposon TNT 1-94 [Tanacetum coccineum]